MEKGPVFLTHMYTLIVLVATHYVLYIRRHFACRVVNTWNVSRLIVLTSAHCIALNSDFMIILILVVFGFLILLINFRMS